MMKKAKKKVFLLINVAEKAILLERGREDNTNRFRTVYYISVKISITTQYIVSEKSCKKRKRKIHSAYIYIANPFFSENYIILMILLDAL